MGGRMEVSEGGGQGDEGRRGSLLLGRRRMVGE